ncbi:hypothetical protein [Nonomuraea sp. NPDC050202]|uniref:hypothetical protein n=1 Tax=Nonomuraea sp. NPDC050202 TaxID=3155035 RepID=UPI0033DE704C
MACHAEAENFAGTDWAQILVLDDMLLHLAPSPVTRLHRPSPYGTSPAPSRPRAGPEPALAELDELGDALERYPLFFATRAEPLRDLGRDDEARRADERALRLTASPARQAAGTAPGLGLNTRVDAGPAARRTVAGRR